MKKNEIFIRHIFDEILKRAFLRSLEIIGEATKNISMDFREDHSDIKWKEKEPQSPTLKTKNE